MRKNLKQLTSDKKQLAGNFLLCKKFSTVKCQMLNNKCPRSGFTIVETMVAISILMIAVVGPMSIIGDSLSQIRTARDQVIAINLAQEGIEVVRQKRDSNMLARWNETTPTTLWSAGLAAGNYIISAPTLELISCFGCVMAVYLDVNNFYTQGSVTTATQFSRVVNISDIVSAREKSVTSTVTWKTSVGVNKTITVSESIFGINS